MYTTKYLRTDSYESFFAECEKVGLVVDGEIITSSHNHSMILLPNLCAPSGAILTDSDGNEYPETKELDGYHVNLKYKSDIGLNHLSVDVKTPLVM